MHGPARQQAWGTVAAWAAVLLAFAAMAGSAVATKSPTMDEPVHAMSGWLALRNGDYRLEVANPAGWKMWAALADACTPLRLDQAGPLWRPVAWHPAAELPWVRQTLFDTPGNDGGRFVARARFMMLTVAIGLCAATAAWAYQLAGPVAAVVAVCLLAFDPTVLGQAPLVKSDLAEGLALVAAAWLTWRLGQRVTVGRVIGLAAVCGAAINVKFSGVLVGPMVALPLVMRALSPAVWPTFGGAARTRLARVAVVAVVATVAVAGTVGVTWACYRFRYAPTPSPGVAIDMAAVRTFADAAGAGPIGDLCVWVDQHRLLPQAFTAGLLNQAGDVRMWPAYLDGVVYSGGRWQYFPLALAYKTPLVELATAAVVIGVGLVAGLKRTWRQAGVAWGATCVAIPGGMFGAAALATSFNAGLRSLLPLYPFLAIAGGAAAAWAWRRRPGVTAAVGATLLVSQVSVAVRAWPDYISYFNSAVDGSAHLSDGNLDWGQDIPYLVDWQRRHPGMRLYIDLFTPVDPTFYGLRYQKLWERTAEGRPRLNLPAGTAVVAVSVTHLQGMYVDAAQRPLLSRLAAATPVEVLHGTIRLYDWPLPP
jgi:hypothetical protein